MTRLWLVFAQVCTVCLAVLFTVSALRPEWLSRVPFVSAPTAPPAVNTAPIAAPAKIDSSTTNASIRGGFADAAGRALPSVVKIATSAERKFRHPFLDDPTFQRFFGRDRNGRGNGGNDENSQQMRGEGSGVIVRKDGYILTNNHVVEGAQRILVELSDKRVLPAKIVGTDPETDLAVIKIDGDNFPAVGFGDSRLLQAGEIVLAIGNPFGVFGNTVTMGIVSAVGRTQIGEGSPFESFIQTDAAINQGNSGGALVSAGGELIGINTSIFTRTGDFSGIGFAIPTAIAVPIMEQLIATGEVKRGYLGASLGSVSAEIAERLALKETTGAYVDAVVDGGPGARAGLRPNDVIVEVNGRAVKDRPEAINTIAGISPGQTVELKLRRRGELIEIKVTLDKRPNRPRQ
ncbi:MAG: PDZ domain-containing protein [Betaproteobacteria bacterium]|nr:MAG: PDZ domain-containing protein [Betaproteobacteria bacterium]